jgi:hypothetical protein
MNNYEERRFERMIEGEMEDMKEKNYEGVFVQRTASGVFAVVMPDGKYLKSTGTFSEGFECGYHGQGPTELAFVILKHYYPLVDALNIDGMLDEIEKIILACGEQVLIEEKTIKMIQEEL